MPKLSCPYCNKTGLSLLRKFNISPSSSIKCKNCGRYIGIPSGKFIIASSIMSIFIALSIIFSSIYIFLIGCIISLILHLEWVPIVKTAPPSPHPLRKSKLITVLKANNSAQLTVAKSLLESTGIPCFAKGEMTQKFVSAGQIGTRFHLTTGPIELQVISDNASQAQEILKEIIDNNLANQTT